MILYNDITGFAGGSYFAHTGAAAEYVCLSPNPVFTTLPVVVRYAFMYGAEYDSNAFGHDNGDDIPCAVCHSRSTTSSTMIPGTNNCVSGWRTQYKGYLAAGAYNEQAASQYICLDAASETVVNGHDNNNGKLVQPVKSGLWGTRMSPVPRRQDPDMRRLHEIIEKV